MLCYKILSGTQNKAIVSQQPASIYTVISSSTNDQLPTSSKIISTTKEKIASSPMAHFHLVIFMMCIILLRMHEFFYLKNLDYTSLEMP